MDVETYERRTKHDVKESTLKSRISALHKFSEFANVEDREPTAADVEKWVDYMIEKYEDGEVTSGTIKQYFKAVKYYFKTVNGNADDIEHIRDWIPTGSTDHGEFLEHKELDDMRKAAFAPRDKAILELMYNYARRPGEIELLNLEDISYREYVEGSKCPECGEDIVDESITKSVCSNSNCMFDDADTITFPILKKDEPFRATFELVPRVKQALQEYITQYRSNQEVAPEQPWEMEYDEDEEVEYVEPVFTTGMGRISYSTIWKDVKNLADGAGIEKNITPKSMRHSRATHLDWSGQSPEVIARQQLVHDPDSQVIGSYVHPRDEQQIRTPMTIDEDEQ